MRCEEFEGGKCFREMFLKLPLGSELVRFDIFFSEGGACDATWEKNK